MPGQSDVLTSAQNIATALNGIIQVLLNIEGAQSTDNISAATLVKSGPGRVARVIVTTAGATGKLYDANMASATSNPFFDIPATLGVYELKFPYTYGLVVVPGAAQVVSVSWS